MFVALMMFAAVAGPGPAGSDAEANQKVCKRLPEATGSIMPRRECRTKAEWAALEKAGAESTDRFMKARDANRRALGQQGL